MARGGRRTSAVVRAQEHLCTAGRAAWALRAARSGQAGAVPEQPTRQALPARKVQAERAQVVSAAAVGLFGRVAALRQRLLLRSPVDLLPWCTPTAPSISRRAAITSCQAEKELLILARRAGGKLRPVSVQPSATCWALMADLQGNFMSIPVLHFLRYVGNGVLANPWAHPRVAKGFLGVARVS